MTEQGTMAGMTATTGRLPRFEQQPDLIPAYQLQPRDFEILLFMSTQRFARSSDIIAWLCARYPGTSAQKVKRRLQILYHSGLLDRPDAQKKFSAPGTNLPYAYILGNRGVDLLTSTYGLSRAQAAWPSRPRTKEQGKLLHALDTTAFAVALEIACLRRGNFEVIPFQEILETQAPPSTQSNPRAYHWPVKATWRQEEATLYVIPDRILGIRDKKREEGKNRKYFFVELDRGHMPVVRSSLTQSSILRKLISYTYTYRQGLHRSLYGLGNFRMLGIVPTRYRINTIIDAFKAHITEELVSPRLFLFAVQDELRRAGDFLAYQWTDAAGERHRLLD